MSVISELLTELKEIKKEQRTQNLSLKRVLSLEEVEEYFKIPRRTIYNLTSKKLIPHSKKSGLWFNRVDVENWLLSNPVTTDQELERIAANHILKNRR